MNNILLVEDNAAIARGLCFSLQGQGFAVVVCESKAAALSTVYTQDFDLVLLDVMLPDGSGFDVCRELRENLPDLPIIFLTARDGEDDAVMGLDLGAEDYVVKPFRPRELVSRMQRVLRRAGKGERTITVGDLTVDAVAMTVKKGETDVSLSALEFRILLLLLQNRGNTVTRETLFRKIWDVGGNYVNDNTLTVYIKRLREKCGADLIRTVKGVGYRVES